MQCGNGIDREDVPPVEVPIGAPPLMDDLCVPLMDDCPGRLLRKVVQAAKILEATASDFGFAIQYGVGKTEASVAIRGKGKKAVMTELAAHTEGVGLARVSVLRISLGKSLRVVCSYKHLGAAAQASTKFSKEVAMRCVQAAAVEACLARAVCGQVCFPRGCAGRCGSGHSGFFA